jgi:hypothetical protein
MSAHSVATIDPNLKDNPLCHVCGAVMMRCTHQWLAEKGMKVKKFWKCGSCGATTGAS